MNTQPLPFCALRVLEPGMLGFELDGEMSLDRLVSVGGTIADTCTRQKAGRALADARRMTGDLSILEWHSLATAFESSWPGVRLAIVDRADRLKPDRFLETSARNRGINVRVFDDPQPALDWLRA
jgi:hypothetical protein